MVLVGGWPCCPTRPRRRARATRWTRSTRPPRWSVTAAGRARGRADPIRRRDRPGRGPDRLPSSPGARVPRRGSNMRSCPVPNLALCEPEPAGRRPAACGKRGARQDPSGWIQGVERSGRASGVQALERSPTVEATGFAAGPRRGPGRCRSVLRRRKLAARFRRRRTDRHRPGPCRRPAAKSVTSTVGDRSSA